MPPIQTQTNTILTNQWEKKQHLPHLNSSETDNLTKNKPTTNKTTKPTTVKSQKKLDDYKTTEQPAPKFVNIMGGWHNGADYIQYGSTTANAIYQMLFAYQIKSERF